MNRSAYLSAGLAIGILSKLSRANVVLHGESNVPQGPVIFVVNHFTRIETFLLPYHIYHLTHTPVWSLADAPLFQGGFGRFIELLGAVSTDNPDRNRLIVRTLLTGEANWIIFPEGSMVKTKKIIRDGHFMVTHPHGMREPHTGAASFALLAELIRRALCRDCAVGKGHRTRSALEFLGIDSLELVCSSSPQIVPVNLTYYPIRAHENIASTIAAKMVKDIPDRTIEEIMTEGTMLLSGVDLDIRFGTPITIDEEANLLEHAQGDLIGILPTLLATPSPSVAMHSLSKNIMQRYMQAIYTMTTVNHDHLFASFLRLYPYRHIKISDLKRRVFYAASLLRDLDGKGIFLHQSLQGSQTHLVTDDRYGKFANFLELALDKGVLQQHGETLLQDRSKLSKPISFHRGRIDNPIEVIANEAEPLHRLRGVLHSLAWQPDLLLRINLIRHLLRRERHSFRNDFNRFSPTADRQRVVDGMPFLFSGLSRKIGVVLVHSYLSVPGEVRDLARFLNRLGYWVYAPRLPGHGTSPIDLASRTTIEWLEAVETGFAIMQDICDRVVLGGMSVGGSLALQLAASTVRAAGLFAVCPPMRLKDYSTRFMPAQDTWDRMLSRMKGENLRSQFVDFSSGNPHINYSRNPLSGISEVGSLLERLDKTVRDITLPVLILQADNDPVLNPKSARLIFDRLASTEKEFSLVNADHHVIISGEGAERVHRKIGTFIRELR